MEDSRYRVPISEKERSFQHNPQLSILNSQFLLLLVSSIVIAIVLASCGFVANLDHDLEEQGLMADAEWLRDEISVPGLVLAVAEPGNDVLVAAAGFADLDGTIPLEPDSRFFLGGVSTTLFATVLLQLAEEGALTLDDPLSRYLEWPRGDEISIRMLLAQTSGIPDFLNQWLDPDGAGEVPELFRRVHRPEEILERVRREKPLFQPGTEQRNSHTNGLLVGAVLERVTARSLSELLEERIVVPLLLENTCVYGASSRDLPRLPGFRSVPGWGLGPGLVEVSFADETLPDSAHGSVVSTALDLLRYHQALRGGELLGERSWAEMRRVEPGFRNGLAYLLGESALGPFEGNVGRAVGHSAVSYYHVPTDLYVVLLTNRGDGPLALNAFLERRYGKSFLTRE